MFRYVLRCQKAHKFEAWFGDEPEPSRMAKLQSTACPACELSAQSRDDAEAWPVRSARDDGAHAPSRPLTLH